MDVTEVLLGCSARAVQKPACYACQLVLVIYRATQDVDHWPGLRSDIIDTRCLVLPTYSQ